MNRQVDIIMSDHKEPLDQQVKRLEKQAMELQLSVSEMGAMLTEMSSMLTEMDAMLTEMRNTVSSTRHKTNEYLTDLYGIVDHVGCFGKEHKHFSRQKIPIKHYV
jgi:hypothetical protein